MAVQRAPPSGPRPSKTPPSPADQEVELEGTATFEGETPEWIYFASGGGLDRRRHPEPQEIVLTYNDGTQERIAVGIYGTVE